MPTPDRYHFVTAPICKIWEGLLRRAKDIKGPYIDRCAQVEQFYSGMANFMWGQNYMSKFMGGTNGLVPPKFQITIKKAFEYVAVMKPMLFWQMATRKVIPHEVLQLDPLALFGIPNQPPDQLDPATQAAMQHAMDLANQQALVGQKNEMRAKLLQCALNYFPREQPGGLASHINACLDDLLLYGAAFMATEPYQFPQSDRVLVKSVRVPNSDVFVDPDCTDPLWLDAKWVAIRHEWTYTETEAYFNLPLGSLRDYGTKMTTSARWQRGGSQSPTQTADSKKDLIEWYEVFSRAGCGNQLVGNRGEIEPEFDDTIDGNAAYLCIAPGCPYPLNLPSGLLMGGSFTPEQESGEEPPGASFDWVREQLRWPTEYWRDEKWPIAKISLYTHTSKSVWPEPPLSSAIGELTALNILSAAYVQTAYENRQQIIGVMKGMVDNLQQIIDAGKSPAVVELEPHGSAGMFDSVQKVIQFMQRPEINQDVPKTIEFLMRLIEQRTGMSPVLYGESAGSNPRSAAEYNGRQNNVNLRPEYMRKSIAEWQSEVADMEVFCAQQHVQSHDLKEQLGPLGMPAWDMLVTNEDPEAILRGAQCRVEASEIGRPNKERDATMLDRMQQVLVPILAGHLAQHNDPKPLNGFWEAVGEATEIDVKRFAIPEPEPDSQAIQMQQGMQQAQLEQAQAEAAKTAAETQKIYADINGTGLQEQTAAHDMQLKQQAAEHQMSIKEQEAQLKAKVAEHQMAMKEADMQLKSEASAMQTADNMESAAHQMELKDAQAIHDMSTKSRQAKHASDLRTEEARQKLALQIWQAKQAADHAEQSHQQAMTHAEEKAAADAQRSNMINASRMMMQGLRSSTA